MDGDRRLLMIGLDAAEPRLVERWTDDGTLPNLAKLRSEGAYGRLAPPDAVGLGPPWPSFYTSTPASVHGLYTYVIWSPERMTEVRPTPETLPLRPFWRELGPDGPRVIAIDVPLVHAPRPFRGIEVSGWATHEHFGPMRAYPPGVETRLEARFGPPPMPREVHAGVDLRRLLEERDVLVDATDRAAEMSVALFDDEPWELGIACFSAAHRGGHKLWGEAGSTGRGTREDRSEFASALRDVYVAVDRAVGRMLSVAGPETSTLVFSLHGMGPNGSLVNLLPEMVSLILDPGSGAADGGSWLERARRAVPRRWRDRLKRSMPMSLQDRLSSFWRTDRLDWSRTRAFCLAGDLHGFIRVNVRGRERDGIVEPGAEYDDLCERLAEGLSTFVDPRTGNPVVARVIRRDELAPDHGPRADIPDLTVVWEDRPAAERDEIVSEPFGSVRWPTPGAYADGRSGNHRSEGFGLLSGAGIAAGALSPDAGVLDLAPTALDLLGLDPLPGMYGRSLLRGAAAGSGG